MDFMLLGGVFLLGAAAGLWFGGAARQVGDGLDEQNAVSADEGEGA